MEPTCKAHFEHVLMASDQPTQLQKQARGINVFYLELEKKVYII